MASCRKLLSAVVLSLFATTALWAADAVPSAVNINQADAATIAQVLKGVGPARAKAIVEWRTAHGPFKSVEDLALVKGVGEELVAQNRQAILLK